MELVRISRDLEILLGIRTADSDSIWMLPFYTDFEDGPQFGIVVDLTFTLPL